MNTCAVLVVKFTCLPALTLNPLDCRLFELPSKMLHVVVSLSKDHVGFVTAWCSI